jgi:hypothetical protein
VQQGWITWRANTDETWVINMNYISLFVIIYLERVFMPTIITTDRKDRVRPIVVRKISTVKSIPSL